MPDYMIASMLQFLAVMIAAAVTWNAHERNRKVRAAFDLFNAFYGDEEFAKRRLRLFDHLDNIKKDEAVKWNIEEWRKRVGDKQTNILDETLFGTLNRVVAFYWQIQCLIEKEEVDIQLVSDGLKFNYDNVWNPYRQQFHKDSEHVREFFPEVKFVKSSKDSAFD